MTITVDVTPPGWPPAPSKALRWCVEDVVYRALKGLDVDVTYDGGRVQVRGPWATEMSSPLREMVADRFALVWEC